MRIKKLIIKSLQENLLGTPTTEINFGRKTFITSYENGSGKTSLLRFLLYSLGYKIPSTKGFSMEEYSTTLYLEDRRCVTRMRNELRITFSDGTIVLFDLHLDDERWKAIATILEVDNVAVVPYLLGAFYMDQDKGWGLFNRGKIIGENSFYIEAFILSLKNKEDRLATYAQKIKLEREIARYKSILDVYQLESSFEECKPLNKQNDLSLELNFKKNVLIYDIEQVAKQLKNLEKIVSNNRHLISTIEGYRLLILFEGKEFTLKKSHIKNYEANQNILKVEIRSLQIEKTTLFKELDTINLRIEESQSFFSLGDMSDEIVKQVQSIQLNEVKLNNLIKKLQKELTGLKNLEKDMITSQANDIYVFLANQIKKYAEILGVFSKIDDEKDFVLTRNLKAFSGVTLNKLSLAYKLSYFDCLKEFLNIDLPFILDSPGSGEATDNNVELMVQTIYDNLTKSQIIIASVVPNAFEFADKKIVIINRLMDKSLY